LDALLTSTTQKGIKMKLLTKQLYQQFLKNGSSKSRNDDHYPVVKLFIPGSNCIWLLTEIYTETPSMAFGLCDLGMGYPEYAFVDFAKIKAIQNIFGKTVERDLYFKAKHPISVYARAAFEMETIIEVEPVLNKYIS
jgi:hypothetical protein